MSKKANRILDKFTEIVSIFVGSWPGVLFHTIWFTTWLALKLDISLLTLIVSLEAIYICIFLLMAANKEEETRQSATVKDKIQDRQQMNFDIKLDQKADRQLTEIKHLQKELHSQVKQILSHLNGKKK